MNNNDFSQFTEEDIGNEFTPKTVKDWTSIGFTKKFAKDMVKISKEMKREKATYLITSITEDIKHD